MRHTDWIDRDIAMYARFEWCEGPSLRVRTDQKSIQL